MVVRMDDDSEAESGPGDLGSIPPGHDVVDSWERTFRHYRLSRRRGVCQALVRFKLFVWTFNRHLLPAW
jgi:hypothetical protein